ncbi:hypothetical protein PB2503_11539 [Parvularcula bermudensis HTCC2503]|uniref:5-hydroxyisourate hydrolase n=1 Tax=Parvularcula bermudensis (strain ATCC BAA-594 / HTCC2503 / KCTC 12087) TaxID=314260 RepID=E0TCX0_PARBH|nr:hydroxyisourate hydrolase [Parvularcula bermudensis]ADM10353.1 hypothetical protein PB2503_11539 [Parvularcula bermudensis HTCC2503]
MSGLSTHILDLTCGQPAVGVAVSLFREETLLGADKTNEDGRCRSLLGERALTQGAYRLMFSVGDYFKEKDPDIVPFFDTVSIDFVVSDVSRHHHVPLLVTPHAYSTYRGS